MAALRRADIAVLLQPHSVYADLEPLPEGVRLFDTRGVLSGPGVVSL